MKHYIKGDYVLTELMSAECKKQYWISKKGFTVAYYCWTSYSKEDDEKQLKNMSSYINLFELKNSNLTFLAGYNKGVAETTDKMKCCGNCGHVNDWSFNCDCCSKLNCWVGMENE